MYISRVVISNRHIIRSGLGLIIRNAVNKDMTLYMNQSCMAGESLSTQTHTNVYTIQHIQHHRTTAYKPWAKHPQPPNKTLNAALNV